ncbi:hypothetical protein MHYP_G00033760 [Metynnis hypsauchen]
MMVFSSLFSRQNGYAATFPGRSSGVSSAPSSPFGRFISTGSPPADGKPDRPALGGLLTSSYRQHQESLAAERERRRLEREERLHRIEREERTRFNRDYVEKREEVRHAREERYKQVERLAAEECERERVTSSPRGRTEITLSLSSRTPITTRCHTHISTEPQEDTHIHTHSTQAKEWPAETFSKQLRVDMPYLSIRSQSRSRSQHWVSSGSVSIRQSHCVRLALVSLCEIRIS